MNYEQIEKYLNGELEGEELLAFENDLRNDAELAKEVKLYRSIETEMKSAAAEQQEEAELRKSLNNLGDTHFKKKAKLVGMKRTWWYVSAAAASVLIFLLVKPLFNKSFDKDKLYAGYMKEVEGLPESQRGNNPDSLYTEAAQLYNHKDYKQALPLLEKLIEQNKEDIQVKLAAGICYMQVENYSPAVSLFDSIAAGTSVYKNQALWMKALVLLKQNKLAECYDQLKLIPADADKYEAAQALLKKLSAKLGK